MDDRFLADTFDQIGISLTNDQIHMFDTYYDMIVEKNKVMNLTKITDYHEAVIKHFVDSCSLVLLDDDIYIKKRFTDGASVIDVGTGAGFPGIPLKIIFPQIRLTLLDSVNKKLDFLRDVSSELGFTDINIIHGRAEDISHQKGIRESFDFCVSRAVGNLAVLSEYCLPFVKKNGFFISYKSERADDELKQSAHAFSELRGKLIQEAFFDLPESDISRTLLLIMKTGNTPKIYPRKAGTPSKNPL
ncbi:16S rRNA (guanine(527)-N(7))-methyltransferase RsmG [Candidatus Weimeria sp. HCP3S3_B5]|uniref:16S rRNA (guanine(527)-N(7))-methyltransferase RsmG n=1 Tax=Candidatus Weimeria sp. HCP3S3_B5 TaxID=3438871 RepID=UPI003F8B4524